MNGATSAKVNVEAHFISIDDTLLLSDLINKFQVCCVSLISSKVCINGMGRGENKHQYNTPVSRTLATETTQPKGFGQGDSYFWTYTIVIANLFAIAVVVFVGMWWRNRNMAKTLNADGRGDRFTELELFSAPSTDGRLPLSKKD